VRSIRRITIVDIGQLTSAEPGWKAVFTEPDGSETMSRILGWAVVSEEGMDDEVVGVIVDPIEPARIVRAHEAESPDGGTFLRYRFVPPDPTVVTVPAPAPPAEQPKPESTTEQVAKGLLKRK